MVLCDLDPGADRGAGHARRRERVDHASQPCWGRARRSGNRARGDRGALVRVREWTSATRTHPPPSSPTAQSSLPSRIRLRDYVHIHSARPGSRAPHVWLEDGRSTLDLYETGMVVISGADGDGWVREGDAASRQAKPFSSAPRSGAGAASRHRERGPPRTELALAPRRVHRGVSCHSLNRRRKGSSDNERVGCGACRDPATIVYQARIHQVAGRRPKQA
jgi:hypothetical protein